MTGNVSRRQLLAGGSLVAAVGLAGCVVTGSGTEEPIDESYDATDVDALSVTTRNGRLSVVGEDRETVSLRGEKVAASEDDLESVWLEVTEENRVLDVTAQREEDESFVLRLGPSPRVDLEVAVPEDLRVDHVETRNGTLHVSNVTGGLVAETRNGALTIGGVDGDLRAETRNGDVDTRVSSSLDATITLETRNGDVSVDGIDGVEDQTAGSSLDVTAGDGTHRHRIETRNGDVSVVGED